MIFEDEGHECFWRAKYDCTEPMIELVSHDESRCFYEYLARDSRMQDRHKHRQLRADLVEYIWVMHAEQQL